jgi:CubicO group peptidase (beta-lactamase class C family)
MLTADCTKAPLSPAAPLSAAGSTFQPVSAAQRGFTPEQVAGFHAAREWQDILKSGDVPLYMFLHLSEFYPSTVVHRNGPMVALEQSPDMKIGAVRIPSPEGTSLDEYLTNPGSRAQGMIVIHKGKIIFERYPGMREDDTHITMSVAKTMPALVIGVLEEEGRIDVEHTIGSYVPALNDTAWNEIKVIDVLNMASGLDVEETEQNRDDARSTFGRFLRAVLNVPGPDGKVEKHTDVIRSPKKLREPGHIYEYSSINTQVLVLLAQAVEHRSWAEIFQNRVWSNMNAEGDVQVCVTPDGIAMPYGLAAMRLRDLARFGMLYTPNWARAARRPVVTADMIEKIRKGASAQRNVAVGSSRHWDCVFNDGDFYKGGLHGQGLYVSPGKDLVIAWFSTAQSSELLTYGLAIAKLHGYRHTY